MLRPKSRRLTDPQTCRKIIVRRNKTCLTNLMQTQLAEHCTLVALVMPQGSLSGNLNLPHQSFGGRGLSPGQSEGGTLGTVLACSR